MAQDIRQIVGNMVDKAGMQATLETMAPLLMGLRAACPEAFPPGDEFTVFLDAWDELKGCIDWNMVPDDWRLGGFSKPQLWEEDPDAWKE